MGNDKKLSIIIPLYNVEEYVAKAAESVASQSFDGLEVVVIDDGSTDNSFEVCMKALERLDVVSIRQENAGQSAARNAGIEAASGEYILFLDSDDFLLPDALKNIMHILENEKLDVLFGRYLRWTPETGFIKGKEYDFNPPEKPARRTEYILSELPEPPWNLVRYICRRNMIEEHQLSFKMGVYCEDVKWSLEVLEAAEKMSFIAEPFYAYYYRRPSSTMNSMTVKRLCDLNSIVRELIERFKDRPIVCRELIKQSFLYINEYCYFNKADRNKIYESYETVLPLYKLSDKKIHRIAGELRNPALIYMLSIMLCVMKYIRRILIKIKGCL